MPDQEYEKWQQGQTALAQVLADWRAGPAVAPVLRAMELFGAGRTLDQCLPLAQLFGAEEGYARQFAESFVAAGLSGLEDFPAGQLPLPHGSNDAAPSLVLARSGRASLAITAYDGDALKALPAPKTARFLPQESWIRVLSGSAQADLVLRRNGMGTGVTLQSGKLSLEPGMVFYRYGLREALQVRRAEGNLVVLRLQRQLAEAEPAREYSLPDGSLVQQASARPEDTRRELAVALLGRMKRKDALVYMARIASGDADREAGEALRWQALREVLALDTAAGLELLGQVAAVADDPLSRPAASLRASLQETLPGVEGGRSWHR